MPRKIAFFTGARSDYGLLAPIINETLKHSEIEVTLLVGGAHYSHEQGFTVSEISFDGIRNTVALEYLVSGPSNLAVCRSFSGAFSAASEHFFHEPIDLLVVLGDRYEALAVAQAAMMLQIPIAHVHGGETTQGAIDEAIRHSITKMSHLHFTSTQEYRNRVVQLGESPRRVFCVGAPGLDNIRNYKYLSRAALSEKLKFNLQKKYMIVTFHPETLTADGGIHGLKNLLAILSDEFKEYNFILSRANSDNFNHSFNKIMDEFYSKNSDRVLYANSLGSKYYLNAMKYCDLVVGNSSSGLIEAPSFSIPTVNIGSRQLGRLAGPTVIHSSHERSEIRDAISRALDPGFKTFCDEMSNPYGDGYASARIVKVLAESDLSGIILKNFYDIGI